MQSATNYQKFNENQVYNPIEKQHIACQKERGKEKHSIEVGWGLSVNLYVFKVTGCIYEDFLYV